MRNGPLPQPSNYLGDDPDLTAELAQRLASTAQTTQGIITNYLFYGQRRAADRRVAQRLDGSAELGLECTVAAAKDGASDTLSSTARTARRDLDQAPPPDATACEPGLTDPRAQDARLTFRVVRPDEAAVADRAAQLAARAGGAHHDPGEDPLKLDGLADDPSQRDPLATPAVVSDPGRVTLISDGPARGR